MLVASLVFLGFQAAPPPAAYVPPPAAQVPGYSEKRMPCTIHEDGPFTTVRCEGGLLDGKSLRELSILRNTIYARYGWSGFRKAWLRNHFQSQPWFKPNPRFSYKQLSRADRDNAHFVAVAEQSITERALLQRQHEVYARRGKAWNDVPVWPLKGGGTVRACAEPAHVDPEADTFDPMATETSVDCRFIGQAWYKPDPAFTDDKLTAEDRVELGLISRALGQFALDEGKRGQQDQALDGLLKVEELRQLSLRDLRLLRNTIYARHGRPFKSRVLQQHFSHLGWYKLDAAYTDARLTSTDKRNIQLIRTVEDEFGGPLADEDWLVDPAVDGA